jgi:hypothetical protein
MGISSLFNTEWLLEKNNCYCPKIQMPTMDVVLKIHIDVYSMTIVLLLPKYVVCRRFFLKKNR